MLAGRAGWGRQTKGAAPTRQGGRRPTLRATIPPPHHGVLFNKLSTGYSLSFAPIEPPTVRQKPPSWIQPFEWWARWLVDDARIELHPYPGPLTYQDVIRTVSSARVATEGILARAREVPTLLPGYVGPGATEVPATTPPSEQTMEEWLEGTTLPPGAFEPAIGDPTMPTRTPDFGVARPPPVIPVTPPFHSEDSEMAVDWGQVITDIGQTLITGDRGVGNQLGMPPAYPTPATMPNRVEVDTRTGQIKPCRRRRRRRLLTPTDLSDLAALQAIVGKGDALKLAVAKAAKR